MAQKTPIARQLKSEFKVSQGRKIWFRWRAVKSFDVLKLTYYVTCCKQKK